MSFSRLYPEILRLLVVWAKQTPHARSIMRKAGVRLGSVPVQAEASVLTVPACVVVGGCPRLPYPPDLDGMTQSEIDDFYATVVLAATGDSTGLSDFHDYLFTFGYGIPIFADEVTILIRGGCSIEADISRTTGFSYGVDEVRFNGGRGALPPGTYWHPLDLTGFATKWDFTDFTDVRVDVTVVEGAPGATLRGVWAPTLSELLAGDYSNIAPALSLETPGVYRTNWEEAPGGPTADVVVAFVLEASEEVTGLVVGSGEIRAR